MIKIHEATGCYAVDALDLPELTDFEAHLANCCSCGHEVVEFCETTAELSVLTETRPPQALRDTVLSTVRRTPQLPTSISVNPPTARPGPRSRQLSGPRAALPRTEVDEHPESPSVDALLLNRQWRHNRLLTGVVAAMLALLVGLGGVAYRQFQHRETQVAQITLENDLYRAPDTETVVADVSGGGHATFVVSRQLDRAMFLGSDLPDPGPGARYTLWTATGTSLNDPTGIVLDNQLSERRSGTKQFFRGDIAHADYLALNIESAGSTPTTPTTPILVAARI